MVSELEVGSCLESARQGMTIINKIIQEHKVASLDYIVVFPHIDKELNSLGVKYLENFVKAVKTHKVVVVYRDEDNKFMRPVDRKNVLRYMQLSTKEMTNILDCYAMMDFSNHMIVVSLTLPNGRYGEKVIENGQMGLAEVVALGIFGLDECME